MNDTDFIGGFVAGAILASILVAWGTFKYHQSTIDTPAKAWVLYMETKDEWSKRMDEAMGVEK